MRRKILDILGEIIEGKTIVLTTDEEIPKLCGIFTEEYKLMKYLDEVKDLSIRHIDKKNNEVYLDIESEGDMEDNHIEGHGYLMNLVKPNELIYKDFMTE